VREPHPTLTTTAARGMRLDDPCTTGVAFLPRDTNGRQLAAGLGMAEDSAPAPFAGLLASFQLALEAEGKSPKTMDAL
jgi:hypothetical protein